MKKRGKRKDRQCDIIFTGNMSYRKLLRNCIGLVERTSDKNE